MANSILSIIAMLIPSVIKIFWWFVNKKDTSEQLRKDMLALIDSLSQENIPVKLNSKYNEQIARIRKQLDEENANKSGPTINS